MIPGNDDSMSSIELFVSEVSKIIKNNKQQTQTKTEQQASSRKSTKKKHIIEVEKDQSNKQPESTKKD